MEMHETTEIGKTVAFLVGIIAFVVIGLTMVPDWIGSGGQGAPEVGRTVK